MRLLWRDQWLEVPCYAPAEGAELVQVEHAKPLAKLENATGRRIRSPRLKLLRFLRTDGPRATFRKARTKVMQARLTDDYHLVLALGRTVASGTRVICLAPRMPPSADFLLVHRDLCRAVGEFSRADFDRVAASAAERVAAVAPLAHQTYLYSSLRPPLELRDALDTAMRAVDPKRGSSGTRPSEPLGERPTDPPPVRLSVRAASTSAQDGDLSVAVLGAGDYVWSEVVPAIRRAGLNRLAICDREPQLAAEAARRLGFATAFTDASAAIDVLDRPGVVVIATNHDSHAELASYALDQGHRVFLEKPAVVTAADLELLTAAVRRAPGRLEIGFNRRYNPLVRTLREELSGTEGPLTLVITIRELTLAPDHWYFWPNQGTRVAGNLCHWLDLAIHLLGPGANPIGMTVSPRIAPGLAGLDTERALSIQFSDGSAAVLVATDRGDDIRGVQEHIEARRGSLTARLDDLWRLALLRQGRISRRRTLWRDKGNQRMYRDAFRRFTRDEPALYPIRDLALVSALQLAATDLVTSGEASRELKGLGADAESMLRAEGGP